MIKGKKSIPFTSWWLMENISQTGIHCQKLVSWTEFLTAFGRKQREMQKEKKKKKKNLWKKKPQQTRWRGNTCFVVAKTHHKLLVSFCLKLTNVAWVQLVLSIRLLMVLAFLTLCWLVKYYPSFCQKVLTF